MNDDAQTIRLMLGYLCVSKESEASLPRKVEILDRFGLSDAEMGKICACTAQSVRNARQELKKAKNGHKKSKKKKKK
jgi:hypothetical protein